MEQKAETSHTAENTTVAANPFFIIFPRAASLLTADLLHDRENPGLKGLIDLIAAGSCQTLTLPNGDRIIGSKDSMGQPIGTEGERFERVQAVGGFAVLKKPFDPNDPNAKRGFNEGDEELLAEIVGPAILVGPAKEDDPTALTPATSSLDEVRRLIAFNSAGLDPVMALMEELLGKAPQWDESVHDEGLVEFRKTLSDDELFGDDACPCPGCQEERERRVKAAGGSTAKN